MKYILKTKSAEYKSMHHAKYYLSFLIFLLISLVFSISVRNFYMIRIMGFLMILGLCLSSYLITRRHRDQLILLPLGILALVVYVALHAINEPIYLKLLDRALWLGFCGYLGLIMFREIFNSKSVGPKEIYGAISVYILIGFIFSQVFETLFIFDPNALSFDPKNFVGGMLQGGDIIYFSFVTLATVGYGDLVPASPITRAFCVLESVIGIMYVAIFIARFVSIHSSKSEK